MRHGKIVKILLPLGYTSAILAFTFLAATLGWICISDYQLKDFFLVLQLILKNGGSYGALLASIVATIFFQSYMGMQAEAKEAEEKVNSIGHYAINICNQVENPILTTETLYIRLIENETDFHASYENPIGINLEFLTSSPREGYLRNIMAFEENYFNRHKHKIIKNYLNTYQKADYLMPLFVRAFSIQETEIENTDSDFLLIMRDGAGSKCFFITAITDLGVFFFIKAKIIVEIDKSNNHTFMLLQQTNYYVQNKKLKTLV